MKTKELIQIVKRYEALYVKEQNNMIAFYEVGSTDPYFVLAKDVTHICQGRTNLRNIKKTNLSTLLDIGDHIVGYVNTPLEEREEEKRYYLVLNLPLLNNVQRHLNKIKNQNEYYLGSKMENRGYQTIFTESEIAEMDITGFKKVEVLG